MIHARHNLLALQQQFINPSSYRQMMHRHKGPRVSNEVRYLHAKPKLATAVSLEGFGEHVFRGNVAAPYLKKHGLALDTLQHPEWTTDGRAEQVSAAVLDWARDHGASVYCHWFQPLGSSGFRHGQSAQVKNHMIEFTKDGEPVWDFHAKNLLRGETDGSSFLNGGLRATHTAAAYLSIDTTSPIFLRGDTIFIPACMVSYHGHALDEKTPLLRACDALSREGVRLLAHLGCKTKSVYANIGLEQELFLINRSAFNRRPDLQFAGRTVIGKAPPRGQELCDHYMAPPSMSSPALACMQEIQNQCFQMGIPLRTRHREVAPNQYEFAPLFGTVTTQIDQNVAVMQIIDECAAQFGLAALLQEKPFQGVNGSGKHNNWSIALDDGTNLLNVQQLAKNTGNADIFPVIMAAIVKAVHDHGDLLRLAIANPGNDFRLGACEAPPAIISTYLGEDMTNFLESYRDGGNKTYNPQTSSLNLGATGVAPVERPSEDRNRTSPFPYGGHRFEFRAVGSSQNVSMVNTVLASITAATFKEFSEAIEAGRTPKEVAQQALRDSWKVIFNGNGYDPANQKMLTERGLWRIDSGVEAMCKFTEPKNVALFDDLKVLTPQECTARQNVLLTHYTGTVEVEANCLVDMLNQQIIPAVKAGGAGPLADLQASVETLKAAKLAIHHTKDLKAKAELSRVLRLDTMIKIRGFCDEAEAVVPEHLWPLATYKELLFLDMNVE